MKEQEAKQANNKRYMSVPEYLEMENMSTGKREYFKGNIFAMPEGMGIRYQLEESGVTINGKSSFTISEYIEIENSAITKNEYLKGQLIAMPMSAHYHDTVQGNILFQIKKLNKNGHADIWGAGARIYVKHNDFFAYPDGSIVLEDLETLSDSNCSILNPSVLIEVTSDTTESFDKGEKFNLYRDIPSLKEYIIICPETKSIETFSYLDKKWNYSEYTNINSSLHLHSLNISIPLVDIF